MATDPVERLIRAADTPMEPRADFAEALLGRLLAQLESDQPTANGKEPTMTTDIATPFFPCVLDSRAASRRVGWPATNKWPSSMLAAGATAALLLLTLASGLFAFGGTPSWSLFQQSTPGVENELIARAEVEITSDNFLNTFTGISRFTLAPGGILTSGPDSEYGIGVYLFEVESGSLTLTADGRAELLTGDTEVATPLASGAAGVMNAGDRGVLSPETKATWSNDGQEPVVVLIATAGEAVDSVVAVEQVDLVKSFSTGWPEPPATFAFHRLTFEPDASLAVAELPGLLMLGVESGSLGVPLANADGTPARIREFRPNDGFVASDWTIQTDGEFHNSGSEPVVVYALLAEPANSPATPEN